MTPDYSIRSTDGRIIGTMVVVLVALVALLGLSAVQRPADPPRLASTAGERPVPTAAAAGPGTAPDAQRWWADESAGGTRSDAAH